MTRSRLHAAFAFALVLLAAETLQAGTVLTVNLNTNDIGFSQVSGLFYGSIPSGSAADPNTLKPIDPYTGALGTAIAIGFDPQRVAVSSDGANVFTVIGDRRGVQRYHVPTATPDQIFTIAGGPQITELYAVPGRPNAVVLHEHMAGFSPPAITTAVYENAVLLPHQVGHGLGVGGPDIIAVDPTDGTRAYGYQNSITSFDHVPMTIGALGIDMAGASALQGVITGFNVGRIAIVGDRLFTNLGGIYSRSLGIQVGAFLGGGNFVFDPDLQRFFSVTTSGSNQTIRAYSLDTLALIGSETYPGIAGSTSSLTRFGADGLGFRTSASQVIFIRSPLVPEPSSVVLAAFGLLGFVGGAWSFRKSQARKQGGPQRAWRAGS